MEVDFLKKDERSQIEMPIECQSKKDGRKNPCMDTLQGN